VKIAGFRTSRQSGDYLRCFNWLPEFAKYGHGVKYIDSPVDHEVPWDYFDKQLDSLTGWCDVLFTTCEIVTEGVGDRILELKRKRGFQLVCDNDDPLEWIREPGLHAESEAMLRGADLVIFVSSRFAKDYAPLAKRSIVQESCQPRASINIAPLRGVIDDQRTNLIFMGWGYHATDLAMIREEIEELIYGGDYRLISIGVADAWMSRHTADELVHVPQVHDWRKLIAFMKGVPRSIALVPIKQRDETRYNNNVKFLDYAICKIPMVVSNVANNDFLEDAAECWKVQGEWGKAIQHVAANDVLRARLAGRARKKFLNQYTVEGNASYFIGRIEEQLNTEAASEISG